VPDSSALTLALHQSHNTRTTNSHLHGSGGINGAQSRTKVSHLDASTGVAAVGKKAHLGTKQC